MENISNIDIENIINNKEIETLNTTIDTQYDKVIEKEHKDNIYLSESLADAKEICLSNTFEKELADEIKQFNKLKESIDAKKTEIKSFIEFYKLGSFKTDLLEIKYTSATTTTSIDSTKLKKELPDVAAKYSKVSAKSSSISVSVKDK